MITNSKYYFLIFITVVLLVIIFFRYSENIFIFSEDKDAYALVTDQESCTSCHGTVKGFSNFHNPELIGCASCHLGNTKSLDKAISHKGMILIPGNLADAAQTCGKCHPNELAKIETSLMTTNSGLVAVDKFFFGEADSPDYHYHIKDLKNSAADKHLRDLCANCHLGAQKSEYGAINQLIRGGGCNACHLNYSQEAEKGLQNYLESNKKKLPQFHPSTNIFVTNEHCFGCHSRSSRISTNFEGLQETLLNEEDVTGKSEYKTMQDKRVYKYIEEDVHHTKGMLCIDCHSSHEVMGDGKLYAHAAQAVKIQCADCHFKKSPNTIPYDSLDVESLLVFMHREYTHTDKQMIAVEKSGHPLVNTYVDTEGNAFLIGKKDGKLHPLNPQSEVCSRDNAHQNVSCASCHSSWTSRCIGCHNEFDKDELRAFDLLDKKYGKGQWKEFVAEFSSSLPALGVRENSEEKHIEPAIPGMILTIDRGSYTSNAGEDILFHRLYAPNSPHTTVRASRDCKSCHSDAATLGYGMGDLLYLIEQGKGKWTFSPDYAPNSNDSLPEDAWIPFLKETAKNKVNATRIDFRPFNVKEQQQLLLVGACLQCHTGASKVMQQSLQNGIAPLLKKLSKECVLPVWE